MPFPGLSQDEMRKALGQLEQALFHHEQWCEALNRTPMSKNPSADQYSEQETGGESHAKSGMEAASHWLAPRHALRLLTDVADFHFSDIAVRGDDGARAIGANDDAAAVEQRGRRRQHP
jgi:hypothetical protein